MRCRSCGQENPQGIPYCEWCGAEIGERAKGATMVESSPAQPPPAPPAVRRPDEKRHTMYDPGADPGIPAAPPPGRDFFGSAQPPRAPIADHNDPFAISAHGTSTPGPPPARKQATLIEGPAGAPQARLAGALFLFKGSTDPGRLVPLRTGRTTIGRDEDRDVSLDDPRVSGEHGFLYLLGSGATFVDTSRNGTRIDGEVVLGTSKDLKHGSVLELGELQAILVTLPVPT